MKANELRIGNHLIKDGVVVTIDGRTIFDIWSHELGFGLHGYQPISITRDWLLKFGFKVHQNKSYSMGHEKIYDVFTKSDFVYNSIQGAWWFHGLLEVQPEYVHQLQNIYFALAGEELTAANHR